METIQALPPGDVAPPVPCRLLIESAPQTGRRLMAIDDALLESAAEHHISTLRWYRWSEPTVSLGYFQKQIPQEISQRFQGLPVVKRLSGGGAILHDQELTYAVALAGDHPLARNPRELYDTVHQRVIAVLNRAGATVSLRGTTRPELGGNFLCFSRGDSFDVVCQGWKVLGSAQRRRKRAVLQHGSLLLRRSAFALEFPGIYDLSTVSIDENQLASRLVQALVELCGADAAKPIDFSQLTSAERTRVAELELRNGVDAC